MELLHLMAWYSVAWHLVEETFAVDLVRMIEAVYPSCFAICDKKGKM